MQIHKMFPDTESNEEILEISPVRQVDHGIGARWMACIRTDAKGQAKTKVLRHHAFFLNSEEVVHSRVAVLIDRCEKDLFSPFNPSDHADKPSPDKKKRPD